MSIKKLHSNYKATVLEKLEGRIASLNKHLDLFDVKGKSTLESMLSSFNEQLATLPQFLVEEYAQAQVEPVLLATPHMDLPHNEERWLYQDDVYEVAGIHTNAEKKLLILEYADKERQKFERLAAKFSQEQTDHIKYERTRIPENIRIEVWRRDEGKCAGCGSRVNLEYDHIVPVSRGGSNTARNVELLCEACNRSKGDRIQ